MTVIKRCEKEVIGTWDVKRQRAKVWLDHFIPHHSRRCLPHGGCPAKHSSVNNDSKQWLDEVCHKDKPKIAQLHQLIDRMKADVNLYIHGYNTCAVECAHGERTALTSKRIEYWSNWEGKCRLLQLLHNHRTRATGETLLRELGWQVMEGVSTHLQRIDRDKAKHHQIKTTPSYNARQKAIRIEKKARDAEDPELVALAELRKGKARDKQQHRYYAKKRLLYEEKKEENEKKKKGEGKVEEDEDGGGTHNSAAEDGRRERGQARKRKTEGRKSVAPSAKARSKKEKMDTTPETARPVLHELVNRAEGEGLMMRLHPAMMILDPPCLS
jgi:hypothetical protein